MSGGSVFAPTRHLIGHDWATGAPVYLPLSEFLGRSVELIGKPKSGKTDLIVEACRTVTLSAMGYVYFDYAATGNDQQVRWDAYTAEALLSGLELPYAGRVRQFTGITDAFIGRHAYASPGGPDPDIRINPFRRCVFPDGTRESVEDVVGRTRRVFAAQYPDFDTVRVQVSKNLGVVATLLIAAGQLISDWPKLFGSEPYRQFLWRRHEEEGEAGNPFVRRQRELLEEILGLPVKERRLEIHSLSNALEPLVSGSLAAFFSDENFRLEDVAYRGKRLFLSVSELNGTGQKTFVMRMVWAMLDTLVAKRRFIDQQPIGIEFIDEVKWLPHDFCDQLALRRNNRWSSVVARQLVHQFEGLGFKGAHEMTAAAAGTRILWGEPESVADARELAAKINTISPEGLWVTKLVETHGAAQSAGSSLSRKESVTQVSSHTRTTGTSEGEAFDALGMRTGRSRQVTASDGTTFGTQRGNGLDVGSSHVDTLSVSRTLTQHRISYDEQVALFAQSLLQQPTHVAVVMSESFKGRVLMRRARQIPLIGAGIDIVSNYLRLNRAYHRAAIHHQPRFEPAVRVLGHLAAPADDGEALDATLVTRPVEAEPVAARPVRSVAGPARRDATPDDDADDRGGATRDAGEGDAGEDVSGDALDAAPVCLPTLASGEGAEAQEPDVLALVATLRFATVQTLILLTPWNYDKVYRALEALRKEDLVERFQLFAGREKGSAPAVYVLTGAGAGQLSPAWPGGAADLQRLVKNVGTRRRDVEDGKATNLSHALATGSSFALLARHARDLDPSTVINEIHFDRSLSIPVDVGPWLGALTDRERLLLGPEVAAGRSTIVRFVPDLVFRITWQPPGFTDRITEVLLAEVETGAGGRDPAEIGAVKGAKVAALLQGVDGTGRVGPIALPNPKLAKVLFWCGSAHLEQGLRAGLRRGLGAARRPVVTTNAALLPLTPPPGTPKKDLPAALAALAAAVGGPVWTWYRDADAAPRFGYPRVPSPPKPR